MRTTVLFLCGIVLASPHLSRAEEMGRIAAFCPSGPLAPGVKYPEKNLIVRVEVENKSSLKVLEAKTVDVKPPMTETPYVDVKTTKPGETTFYRFSFSSVFCKENKLKIELKYQNTKTGKIFPVIKEFGIEFPQ